VQHRGTRNHRDSGRDPRPTCSVPRVTGRCCFQEASRPGSAGARAAKTVTASFSAKFIWMSSWAQRGDSLANHPAESKDLAFARAPNICPGNFL